MRDVFAGGAASAHADGVSPIKLVSNLPLCCRNPWVSVEGGNRDALRVDGFRAARRTFRFGDRS
jgi:hypothetical protein